MATTPVGDIETFIAALGRRRASGEARPAHEVAEAAVAQIRAWGSSRALVAADPLLDELGVPAAITEAGVEVIRWPSNRTVRDLIGLDGPADTCGVTVPVLGVTQRGTVFLAPGPGHGRTIDVLSRFHLPIIPADRLRLTLEAALIETFRSGGRIPSAVSLVSGPSRSSDIEKITTYGAHGALAEHAIVVIRTGGVR